MKKLNSFYVTIPAGPGRIDENLIESDRIEIGTGWQSLVPRHNYTHNGRTRYIKEDELLSVE